MRILADCGKCCASHIIGDFKITMRLLLNTVVFTCEYCHEVNVVMLSTRQLEHPETLPLGVQFDEQRFCSSRAETLATLLGKVLERLHKAMSDQELLDRLLIDNDDALEIKYQIAMCLADLDTPHRARMVQDFAQFFQLSPRLVTKGLN